MEYYPSIDKTLPSIVTVLCRELLIVFPVTLSLLFTMKLEGYVIACTVTEIATIIITYIFILIYEKVKKKNCHGIFMFEKEEYKTFDVSIVNELDNASIISEKLTRFALENGVANRESQVVGLACEEMVDNIVSYCYKKGKVSFIDVSLKINNDSLLL